MLDKCLMDRVCRALDFCSHHTGEMAGVATQPCDSFETHWTPLEALRAAEFAVEADCYGDACDYFAVVSRDGDGWVVWHTIDAQWIDGAAVFDDLAAAVEAASAWAAAERRRHWERQTPDDLPKQLW